MKQLLIHMTDGNNIILDAEGQELDDLASSARDAIGASDTGYLSGWATDGTWVIVPSRSVRGVSIVGFDRPA